MSIRYALALSSAQRSIIAFTVYRVSKVGLLLFFFTETPIIWVPTTVTTCALLAFNHYSWSARTEVKCAA